MSGSESLVPVAVCESCWLLDHTRWEPDSMDETGTIIMKFIGADVPDKVNDGSVEVCSLCGSITVAGIYELRDPLQVFFFKGSSRPQFELEIQDFDGDDY